MTNAINTSMLGFVIGDAIGVPVEFLSRRELANHPVKSMRGYGSHNVEAGTWSDDTSMTLGTMKAIADTGMIDYKVIMDNFLSWAMGGEFTVDGDVFDIGITCRTAIIDYKETGCQPLEAGLTDIRSNGNGSLMRMLPIALYCHYRNISDEEMKEIVNNTSSLTHAHDISRLGCYLYVVFVRALLEGKSIEEAYEAMLQSDLLGYSEEAIKHYDRIFSRQLNDLTIDEISSSGFVVASLEASLWALLNTTSFEQAVLHSVNLGNDTDTIGAITGSMAALVYGFESIPSQWIDAIRNKDYLYGIVTNFTKIVED
ncbi:ADP-ribosylglycohydrolase family protein [Bacillus sp. AGMB 02131]|uniref:ADP-ribosylglycohydrolase family protein n=1 Tax=Peribacillus faecalis TaxID=2772559 RepID=A0A927CTX7_9BACI|nr:ADP-ribosylglycohydrolase family protein [Peribacillus faecalis]MBD3107778.1 ADP-ribosylglycohydrolase family protein [Peribacillus faecalis]